MEVVALGAGVLAAIVMVIAVISIRHQRADVIEERLGRYENDFGASSLLNLEIAKQQAAEREEEAKQREAVGFAARMNEMLLQRDFAKAWRVELSQADLKLTVFEYFIVHILSIIGFFIGGTLLLANPLLGILAGVIGFFAPRIYVGRAKSSRLIKFEEQLPDIIGLWVNGLRAGFSVLQAMEAIAKEAPEPAATEFHRVVQESQLGIDLADAYDHMLQRVESEDLDLIVTAVNIQREVGGNLAEILEVIGHTIRERIKLKGEIRVMTSQGRITGYLISGLPIVLSLFLMVVNQDYMGNLFENQMCGWPMLGAGLGLIAIGTAAIQRIVDIEI
jgi:tight adherence protein B